MAASAAPRLVLASTSIYRKQLLERFGIPFSVARPEVDEAARAGEAPAALAVRLAEAKARAVGHDHPGALIIGSDQVAHLGNEIFGKPGTLDRAIAQLQRMSGCKVVFETAVCLLDAGSGACQLATVPTEVHFRRLSDAEIERYVERERPVDCAGSAKCEALGITLLEALRGDDPTALIGLPLIALAGMLRREGIALP